ncbi:mechanosensitive ion channel family protein [Arenimonas composti]|uniref:Mechanosensing system component YbdG n=1 Tax=Arenimonas composti TR7-09 = DSM 18010 TaxID=1121013 RepID=A0A091BCV6_9GAMM|nr:mechanosensitive ion channel domain-containing protein [Arenimonas composti]KFN49566.1 hypothetical protein P873_10455 [Arenimonas composti TR7-09 = DSM 18010]
MDTLRAFYDSILPHPWLLLATTLAVLALLAWLADLLTHRLLLRVVGGLVRRSPMKWDDILLGRGILRRLAHAVPALIFFHGVAVVPGLPPVAAQLLRNLAAALIVLAIAQAISALLRAIQDVYEQRDPERARVRPIKGYLQVARIVLYLIAAVLMIAVLIERSPVLLLSGVGALAAVLMLVFKDTLLSLVANVQISSNDMVRVGDWIEMPKYGADGDVIDIALHVVKVRNWDKTITTIPTYALVSESFRNWRGMQEVGGRRIKRALPIDQSTVRYLGDDEVVALRRFTLLAPYLDAKAAELAAWNAARDGQAPVNLRRLTNIGCFRAYALAWLRAHPRIHQAMTLLVRQLPPGPHGLPLEIYCFTATTAWGEYEGIQADVFDHLLAILPEFGLRAYQAPSGADVVRIGATLRDGSGAAPFAVGEGGPDTARPAPEPQRSE